ncbi:MAG: ergothioneine biosynthesis protein EgtB, partial [Acidobacteria bacterium]
MYATTDSTSEDQEVQRPHDAFRAVREQTVALCSPLEREDFVVQSMPDASPAKWHLAHTTWFFERFVLREAFPELVPYDERYDYIFNSYYDSVGARHSRAERGLLTRPTVDEVLDYRRRIDERMRGLLDSAAVDATLLARIELGVHHEQQHQEL